jgi:hypothetical protein
MWGSGKGRFVAARTAVALVAAVVLGSALGCSDGPRAPEQQADGGSVSVTLAPELARIRWKPQALAAVAPALVGWREGAANSLVALTEGFATSDGVREVWRAPDGLAIDLVALDATGGRAAMLVTVADGGLPSGQRRALALADADGTREVRLPDGFDFASATFSPGGRLVVVAAELGATSVESTLGVAAGDGRWQPIAVAGELPVHHFVERVMTVEGTDALALVLKTPGTPADRDDEAVVLATLTNVTLEVYTPAFFDDSLPSAIPLDGDEGVVYARTWREVSGRPVVDLVRARFDGTQWEEAALLEDTGIASGIETGQIAACAADGTLWLRSAGTHANGGAEQGERLLRLAPRSSAPEPTSVDVGQTPAWWWVER